MIYLLIGMLSSCRTKTVTEYVSVHDTLRVTKTDTCYKVRTEFSHDTLRIEVEKIITLNQGGDTIRLEVYKDRWRDRVVNKTDTLIEHKTDTIYRVVESEHEKTTVKELSWWERWEYRLLAIVLLCMLAYILWGSFFKGKIKKWLKR